MEDPELTFSHRHMGAVRTQSAACSEKPPEDWQSGYSTAKTIKRRPLQEGAERPAGINILAPRWVSRHKEKTVTSTVVLPEEPGTKPHMGICTG